MKLTRSFAELAPDYDALIVDLWGVLHDGVTAFPHAVQCLERLREAGTAIAILSNAPRRAAEVEARMNQLGIGPKLYDLVLSSGEVAWRHLKERDDPWYAALGERCFHLGPDRDRGMREGLDYDFVETPEDADFLLNTGAHMAEDTVETYGHELEAGCAKGIPMVCANPDLEVIRGGQREICAGMLAQHYEEMGGEVRYHGKPHRDVYDECLAALDGIAPDRLAGVGDSLRTDVAGAAAAGFDGIWVLGGIHAAELGIENGALPPSEKLESLAKAAGQRPVAALPLFSW